MYKKNRIQCHLNAIMNHFLSGETNNFETFCQKSHHHQVDMRMRNFKFDNSQKGVKIIPHSSE